MSARTFAGLALATALAASTAGCGRPAMARDGTVVFQEKGSHGASVLTANGLEYRDSNDHPQPLLRRSVDEPWRAPIGFILPRDGRFTKTSSPTVMSTQGLVVVLRASDTRVPSWGGEVLIRADIIAPAAEGSARWGENVAIVVGGKSGDAVTLADAAFGQLAGRDRVTIFDANGARKVVPSLPASHRSMAVSALRARLADEEHGRPSSTDFAKTIALAGAAIQENNLEQRVLILTDKPLDDAAMLAMAALTEKGVHVSTVSTRSVSEGDVDERLESIREAIPPAGDTTFRSVKLTFEGTPAPSHVLEVSGGEARWLLEAGEIVLGNVRAGEARTEILRVTVPAWVPGESFRFTVTAHVDDLAWGGPREFRAELPCVYDDDLERIAKSRHGDVIAYASALATLRRLDEAFVGGAVEQQGGLRRLAEMHAESMKLLARDTKDAAIKEQADILAALLETTKR